MIKESPLFWPATLKGRTLYVLDETMIPSRVRYEQVKTVKDAVRVIRAMKTRAFGQLLVVLNAFVLEAARTRGKSAVQVLSVMEQAAAALNASRPTFPFSEVTGLAVRWARAAFDSGDDIGAAVTGAVGGYLQGIRKQRLSRVERLTALIKNGDSILTHCNVSGELAMAAALCRRDRKRVQFFATETRPYFQGAKLTCWELKRAGADVTLIADNAAGSVMADGLVNKVVVGSDRNCANGDFANKIGTYQIAVLAREFGIPLYVLTQPSRQVKTGRDIPIEIRDEKELLSFAGRRLVPAGVKGFYPGFDVVPHEYVTKAVAIDVR